jgi:hypothetical protein
LASRRDGASIDVMASTKSIEHAATTLAFEKFWGWLQIHPNCIVRAGTPDMVVYDDQDLHWHFAADGDSQLVQVMRGKNMLAEIAVMPTDIGYVQGVAGEVEDEYIFELISETETNRVAAYHFVLSHGFDAVGEPLAAGRAVH